MISMYSASLGSEKIGCIVSNWHVDWLIDWLIDWLMFLWKYTIFILMFFYQDT